MLIKRTRSGYPILGTTDDPIELESVFGLEHATEREQAELERFRDPDVCAAFLLTVRSYRRFPICRWDPHGCPTSARITDPAGLTGCLEVRYSVGAGLRALWKFGGQAGGLGCTAAPALV